MMYADRLSTNECSHMRMLEEKYWPMFDRNQTSCNIVQHDPTLPNMFQHGVQTKKKCSAQQCWMMSQNVACIRLNGS